MRILRGALFVAAAGVVAIVAPRLIDADRFRPRAEAALSEAAGRPVRLGHLAATLWTGPGAAADGLRVGSDGPPLFEADHARVRVALLPLLRGRVVPKRLTISGGRLRAGSTSVAEGFRLDARLPEDPTGTAPIDGSWRARVPFLREPVEATFRVLRSDGGVAIAPMAIRCGTATLRLEGTAGRRAGAAGARLSLRLEAPEVLAEGHASLQAGRFTIDDLTFGAWGGRGRASIDASLDARDRPVALRAEGDGIRTAPLLAAFAPKLGPAIEGTGSFALEVAGPASGGAPFERVAGSARLAIRDGRIASVGLMRQVGRLLELAGGKGIGRDDTPFESLTATFRIANGEARTDDLAFRSADIDLDGKGSIGLGGGLGLSVLASFSKEASADLVGKTPSLRFRVGEDGRLTVPLKIRGSLGSPNVQLDLDRVLEEGLSGKKDSAKRSLLRKLLRRD